MARSYNFERNLEAKQARRMAREARALDRIERQERQAEALVGQICRDGRPVFYLNGRNGQPIEFAREYQAIEFAIRNRYV